MPQEHQAADGPASALSASLLNHFGTARAGTHGHLHVSVGSAVPRRRRRANRTPGYALRGRQRRTPTSPPATIRGSDPDSGARPRAPARTAKEITRWSTSGSVTPG